MDITAATLHAVSDTLRRWALDEDLKARTMADPALAAAAGRVAARYTAGPDVDGAPDLVEEVVRVHGLDKVASAALPRADGV
ncbi:MAG: hypothetical protein J7474_01340, partial [Arthrobacter sp.]|nr:hypothetical protein [Arthrobacter sp.]